MVENIKKDGELAKEVKGKAQLHLVPNQIIFDVAEVREYAVNGKYPDPNNWKKVDREFYIDAAYRHLLHMVEDPLSVDEESGIEHYKHLACNLAFICQLNKDEQAKEHNKKDKGFDLTIGELKEMVNNKS